MFTKIIIVGFVIWLIYDIFASKLNKEEYNDDDFV